jgi:hypothetical protein
MSGWSEGHKPGEAVGLSFIPAGRSIWPQGDGVVTGSESRWMRVWFGLA